MWRSLKEANASLPGDQQQEVKAQTAPLVEEDPVYTLDELVSRITSENKHDYTDTDLGAPVGRELIDSASRCHHQL